MRLRRSTLFLTFGFLIGFIGLLFLIFNSFHYTPNEVSVPMAEYSGLEFKLKNMQNELVLNQKTLEKVKERLFILEKEENKDWKKSFHSQVSYQGFNRTFARISQRDLEFAVKPPKAASIRMSELYDKLPFDNIDGGVWKQGFEIHYNESNFEKEKLRVFVVPHSHNDPGWIKTFERYYVEQTKYILDQIVPQLKVDSRRRFIWAEISFFSRWWKDQKPFVQEEIIKLLQNGQFEIVTGGWVMNDEANTYYGAMLEQLILGHEWIQNHLKNYAPNHGWSIDPFGMSPTMGYLLKRMGLASMLIQRTHYSVKKELGSQRGLEFLWRQSWSSENSTDILTHMMPFYSYDIPHTCGPDPKICCQFDFDRLPGSRNTCPWKVPPVIISDSNVAERSRLLIDQYKKKSMLFRTNVLLVPLGDDFRYDKASEWESQFNNYQKIFDYINSQSHFNAHLQFGTLSEYFTALRKESKALTGLSEGLFPTLSGDFFTYADRDDHYWSGYFTSRPFYKNMDRVLGGSLRGAEIIFSLMCGEMENSGNENKALLSLSSQDLLLARQNYGLFQHHDGVTGTSKSIVMDDYGQRMLESILACQRVISRGSTYLLTIGKASYNFNKDFLFEFTQMFDNAKSPRRDKVITLENYVPVRLLIYNSHGRKRNEILTVRVNVPNVKVYRIRGSEDEEWEEELMDIQLSPVFDNDSNEILNDQFELSFLSEVKALGLMSYFIAECTPEEEEETNSKRSIATIQIYNSNSNLFQVHPFSNLKVFPQGVGFSLQTPYVEGHFDAHGMLSAITTLEDGKTTPCQISFVRYETRRARGEKSGAYLFLPEGEGKKVPILNPYFRVISGTIVSYVETFLSFVTHKVILTSSSGLDGTGLKIQNLLNIQSLNNVEISMRFDLDIQSDNEFYTDLNGFSMTKRIRRAKLPLQGNFYPIPSLAYIQDSESRFSLLTQQPLGVSSLQSGDLEVMLDRRLLQDDNLGLNEAIKDNLLTLSSFIIVLERRNHKCENESPEVSYPSLLSLSLRNHLLHPLFSLFTHEGDTNRDIERKTQRHSSSLSLFYETVTKDLDCDVHLTNLRFNNLSEQLSVSGPKSYSTALIIHREAFNGCYKAFGLTCSTNGGLLSVSDLFPNYYNGPMKQMTLSLLHDGIPMEKTFTVSIQPMELYTFLLQR